MAVVLVVEDGTALTNSNVYDTLENVDAYFEQSGDATWIPEGGTGAPATIDKQTAMVRAARYLDTVYQLRFKGRKKTKEQAMAWPRINVFIAATPEDFQFPLVTMDGFLIADNEIPIQIKHAFYESAKRALGEDLLADVAPGQSGVIKDLRIGDFAVEYFPGGNAYKRYRTIDALLQDMLEGSGTNVEIVRG